MEEGSAGRAMRVVAHLLRHDSTLRVASGVLRLLQRVGPVVVLDPVTKLADLPEAARAAGAVLVLVDGPASGCGKAWVDAVNQAAREVRTSVLVRDAPHGAHWHGRLPLDSIVLPRQRHPPVMALALAHRIWSASDRRFMGCLPLRLDPDLRLTIFGCVLGSDSPPHGIDLASRCEREFQLIEWNLRRAGIPNAAELCAGLCLWRAVELMNQEVTPELAARACGFADLNALARTARDLVEVDLAKLRDDGAGPLVLDHLRKRWARGPVSEPVPTRSDPLSNHLPPTAEDVVWFEEIYERGRRHAKAGARQRGASDELAEDSAQEVLTRIWEKGRHFRQRELADSYFCRAGRNVTANALERKHHGNVSLSALKNGRGIGAEDWNVRVAPLNTGPSTLLALVDRLPEPARTIVRLRIDDWTHAEIAEVLGINTTAVEQQYSRARSSLVKLKDTG